MKEKQGTRAGRYKRSSDVNGKPSYRKDDKAIWYIKCNQWLIGDLEDLGSTRGSIYAKDDFGGLTDEKNVWRYSNNGYSNNGWKTAGKNDITVECTSGTSKLLKTHFSQISRSFYLAKLDVIFFSS